MKFLLFSVIAALCLLNPVSCEDSEGGGGGNRSEGLWSKLKAMAKEFMSTMRNLWGEMKEEIQMRSRDMGSWTKELFDSFKLKMNEWINQNTGASETEKNDMRKYIERLQMPQDEKNGAKSVP